MATDATFDNQLQALANATANFANGKDAAIKNTIITALGGSTQSGGSTGELTFTVTPGWDPIDPGSALDTYSGYQTIEGGVRLNFKRETPSGFDSYYIDVTAQ